MFEQQEDGEPPLLEKLLLMSLKRLIPKNPEAAQLVLTLLEHLRKRRQ